SNVVVTIVPVTAMPYAAPRLAEERNPITAASTSTSNMPLIHGTKICPDMRLDVCTTRMRGEKPSCTASRVIEYAPEITAWEAITVATAASTIIGTSNACGTSR